MAEVLSPFLPTTDMLQARPASSDNFPPSMSGQSHQQQRFLQMQRQTYSSHSGTSGYRGTAAAPGPVSPYAFKSTPDLRQQLRSTSSPAGLHAPHRSLEADFSSRPHRTSPRPTSIAVSSASSPMTYGHQLFSQDDSVLSTNFQIPPFTTSVRPTSMIAHNPSSPAGDVAAKASPDRYRRAHRRTESSTSAGQQDSTELPFAPTFSTAVPSLNLTMPGDVPVAQQLNVTDQQHSRNGSAESAKRYRRRSAGSLDTTTPLLGGNNSPLQDFAPAAALGASPISSSRPSSANHSPRPSSADSGPRPASRSGSSEPPSPTRTAAAPAIPRRLNNPSPLSRPINLDAPRSSNVSGRPSPAAQPVHSPAAAAMAALNDKDAEKGMKSRLRRAFSFGTAHELRRAAGENTTQERARLRKEQFSNGLDEEQNAIIQQQEAAGLGNSIYSGQGNVFTGSTDNLSISSTASSASMMLRKMGQGMKKGGRSLKGLFRPKSVTGVPAADGPVQPASVAQVSMVTVEAERERVNVNANPHDQVRGGTGFPRLERNSMDQVRNQFHGDDHVVHRKAVNGGDADRAEVLSTIRKGILKRSATDSPSSSPLVGPADTSALDTAPAFGGLDRRGSPVPSTASSEPRRGGHRRTDSVTLEGEDYFGAGQKLPPLNTRSLPGTPRSMARNISFSPRLQFHDAFSSSEYDRRGDIATCNRLTPMLAQQIKEELNTFKMEMEVHEASKPHTHFF